MPIVNSFIFAVAFWLSIAGITASPEFYIEINNTSNVTYHYAVFWMDPPSVTREPFMIMGGEVNPNSVSEGMEGYIPGTYRAILYNRATGKKREFLFVVPEGIVKIVISWDAVRAVKRRVTR